VDLSATIRWAIVLSVAAQLITISALTSADPLSVSWYSLLLAIAPVPLAALAALVPPAYALPATLLALVVLVAGIAGGITHTGLFYLPALILLATVAVRLPPVRNTAEI
jgi:hypothetical protein